MQYYSTIIYTLCMSIMLGCSHISTYATAENTPFRNTLYKKSHSSTPYSTAQHIASIKNISMYAQPIPVYSDAHSFSISSDNSLIASLNPYIFVAQENIFVDDFDTPNAPFTDEFSDDFDSTLSTKKVSPVHEDIFYQYNRSVYAFNSVAYQIVLSPFIKTYIFIFPEQVRQGFRNMLYNFKSPMRFVLNIAKGDFNNAGIEFSRFIINSTVGLLGYVDITRPNTPSTYKEVSVDDVLGAWGIPHGPFLMLPLIGPRTVRSTIAFSISIFADPMDYIIPNNIVFDLSSVGRIVSDSAQYLPLFYTLEKTSIDPYIAQREIFWQYMNTR